MKKITTLLAALTILLTIQAESPQKISYQAIIRNTKGALVTNQNVGMKISIQKWVIAIPKSYYSTIYAETQSSATNENGLVSIAIGKGTLVEGSVLFKDINWGAEPLFLKTEIDPAGGNAYSITSTTELLSVPYALHAKTANSVNSGGFCADIDGNVYKTIKIGNQVWMAENLKTTRYRNGEAISNIKDATAWEALTTGAWCEYNNLGINGIKYGHLYNWYAVADPRNISPEGWHIPTDAEWAELESYLIANGGNFDGTISENKIGKSLAATTDWISHTTIGIIGSDLTKNNSSGFSALPAGLRENTFKYLTTYCFWWSSTENSTNFAGRSFLYSYNSTLTRNYGHKSYGYSVRCVKD